MPRGKIEIKGRWDYPPRSKKGKYSKKYFYWFAECVDENSGEVITCAPSYIELSKVLEDIILHEILHYEQTPGLEEGEKRRKQLMDAMNVPIKKEKERLKESRNEGK